MEQQEQNVITLVLTADNHLGYTIPGQPARKREELRRRLRHAFRQVTDFAISQGVDFFLQAGDLFDTTHPDEQDRSFVAERLAELKRAGIHSFAVGGLHDTPAETHTHGGEVVSHVPPPQLSYAQLGALHYFPPRTGETLHPSLLNIRGTLVGLCGCSAEQALQPGLSRLSAEMLARVRIDGEIERAAIPILLLPMPLDEETFTPVGASPLSSLLAQTSFRLVLGGYHHAYRHFTSGQTDVIVAGATHHFSFQDPIDEPGFVFLGIAADGLRWCSHIPVDSIHLCRLEVPLAQWWEGNAPDSTDQADPTARLLEELGPLCTEDAMVQLRLTGEVSRQRYHQLELASIRRYGEAHAFAFSIDDSALTFLSGDETAASAASQSAFEERLSPREELIALADEWIAAAQEEQEQKALLATKEELLAALWKGV